MKKLTIFFTFYSFLIQVVRWGINLLKFFKFLKSFQEINLTDLNCVQPSERSYMTLLFPSLLIFLFARKDTRRLERCNKICKRNIWFVYKGNNNILPLRISLFYPSSVNISWIVKSTAALYYIILVFCYCYRSVYMILGQDQMSLELLNHC